MTFSLLEKEIPNARDFLIKKKKPLEGKGDRGTGVGDLENHYFLTYVQKRGKKRRLEEDFKLHEVL